MTKTQPHALQPARSRAIFNWTRSRVVIGIVVLVLSLLGLGFVLLSPLFLQALNSSITADWTRLSEIGQTYGAASAILAMLALGGIAFSLYFQARQARADQVQAIRQHHLELMRMTLDDPALYLPSWGPLDELTIRRRQQHIFTNLITAYFWMGYETGVISDTELRHYFADIFKGEVARRYWSRSRSGWGVIVSPNRGRQRRFVRIIDEQYQIAIDSGPPLMSDTIEDASDKTAPGEHGVQQLRARIAAILGFAAGIVLGVGLRHRSDDGRHVS
jgi:Family of unknown function (DUF6082)